MTDPMVLYVDPDGDARERTAADLSSALDDRSLVSVADPSAALAAFEPETTVAVVSRYRFPESDRDGLDLLAAIRDRGSETACVLYASTPVAELPTDDVETGVVEYVQYGATDELATSLQRALDERAFAAHPLPDDEAGRLSVLENYPLSDPTLLDALDRLTAIAADCFEAEFVNVHVLSRSRQRSLACRGPALLDAERRDSVCTYAILTEGVTVVEDLHADPRFAEKEYVHEYDLDWYVGAPVVVPPGAAIGTFCMLGRGDPAFSDADRAQLERFAAEAADQFELARLRADAVRGEGTDVE